jgi:hypothetical protein
MDDDSGEGLLVFLSVGTLLVLYLVWAAFHDIAHGERDLTAEYTVLVLCVIAFAFLYRLTMSRLPVKARMVWLTGTGLLVLLFDVGAVNACLRPKYALDPLLGAIFLIAGVPVLGVIGRALAMDIRRCARW